MMHATGAKTAADIAAADDMRILTLNFNGIDGDPISLLTWLDLHSVDVLCLQESKLAPDPSSLLQRLSFDTDIRPMSPRLTKTRRANQWEGSLFLPEDHHIGSRDRSEW